MINKIKAHRFLAGKTQDQIFLETGISQSRLSRIENGYLKPSRAEVEMLAKALNIQSEELQIGN